VDFYPPLASTSCLTLMLSFKKNIKPPCQLPVWPPGSQRSPYGCRGGSQRPATWTPGEPKTRPKTKRSWFLPQETAAKRVSRRWLKTRLNIAKKKKVTPHTVPISTSKAFHFPKCTEKVLSFRIRKMQSLSPYLICLKKKPKPQTELKPQHSV